jgi:ribulose-5-phosphate 4-epimerase/fuculose-1-phosphate aldolase
MDVKTPPTQVAVGTLDLPVMKHDDPARERQHRKEQLAGAFRIFGRLGFGEGVAGHLTARDPERTDCFWVNPFGRSFRQMRASDLVLVDEDGSVVEGNRAVNKAAVTIHTAVHAARPDVVAAAHAHSIHSKALSALPGVMLEPLTQDACAFFEDHGRQDLYGGVVTEHDEGRRVAAAVGSGKAAILSNHGLITVGQTVAEAAWWFITMERSCQAQLLAMAAGKPQCIPDDVAREVRATVGSPFAGWFQLQPLWDEIVESDPALFD